MPDFILSLLVRLINSVIAFVSLAVVARHFGSGDKGVLVESQFVPTFLLIVLIKLGMDTASVVVLRKHKDLKDSVLGSYVLITTLVSVFIWVLQSEFLQPYWAKHFRVDLLYIVMWLVPAQLLHDLCSNAILGCRSFRHFTWFKLFQPLLYFSVLIALWASEKYLGSGDILNFNTVLLVYPLSFGVTALVMFAYLSRHLPLSFEAALSTVFRLIIIGFPIQMISILVYLNRRLDVWLIIMFLQTEENGIYSAIVALVEISWFVSKPLSSMVLERSVSKNDVSGAGRILRFTMFCSSLITVGLIVVVGFILDFYGSNFPQGYNPFLVLAPGVLLFNLHQILSQVFYARGESRRLYPIMLVGLLLNLILNFIWIETYGLMGVALASSISYGVVGMGVLLMAAKTLETNVWQLAVPQRGDFSLFISKFSKIIKFK